MNRARLAAWGVLLVLFTGQAAAQGTPQRTLAARAFDLERSGNYAGAVTAYRALLADDPAMVPALLGLERALSALSRLPEMTKEIQAALSTPGVPATAYAVAIRVWTGAGMPDSARRVVERWAAEDPGNEAPWQEWGYAASARREFGLARTALTAGRARLGRPDALAAELAQLASIQEDYRTAVPEWVQAVEARTEQRGAAEALLGQAPAALRPQVLALLTASGSPVGLRLAAVLTARWGDPLAGFTRLESALSAERTQRIDELVHFQEEISGTLTPAGRLAEGRVLEALAALHPGEAATRYWLDAAQAFSDGGDADAARRTLTRLAGGAGVPPEAASRATVTLVGVLVDEGRVAEADRQLGVLRGTLGVDDRERLTRQIAAGWVREGNLDRAAALMAADSTVEGLDLAGRIQVFRGDLATGAELLRAAGPFAGSRVEASSRLRYLALLQVLAVDSSKAVGLGLLALEQGDTVAAARQLEELVVQFPPLAGGAELGLLAGQLYAALGRGQDAQRLLEQAATSDAPAAAAAAGLELARLDGAQGRRAEAVARLEALILAWPGSAVAPEARRMIDGLRGATPGSR